ncbi:hypothetical protein N431DRAFT_431805 [Stipitochalara longipes BDJ]|nr:hypothetical protein N431DRAFT_431805 [Stipitochalara longipes BDJ]
MTEDNEPAILLGRMPQQTEVRVQEEDWTGKTDAAARRKLQNRLNQRIWRNRRKAERLSQVPKSKPSSSIGEVGHIPTSAESPDGSTTQSQEPEAVSGRVGSRTGRFSRAPARPNPCFNDLGPAGILELMRQYEITAYQAHLLGSPRVDELLTLIQFNVFRALISNTSTLGFSMGWLQEDATSPWSSTCEPINSSCPASLQPTLVQRMIPHHPWIDLFPIPRMRDNMLLAGDSFDEYELCNDLVDFCDVPSERTGLVIWGEPWDPSGWEVSESFLKRWGWVVRGCTELLASTNYWRKQRGEDTLVFEV